MKTLGARLVRNAAIASVASALALHGAAQTPGAAVRDALAALGSATTANEREQQFASLEKAGKDAATAALDVIERRLEKTMAAYTPALQDWLVEHYAEHLIGLEYEQIVAVQRARRLWRSYVLHGGHRKNFQSEFLAPMEAAAKILLIDAQKIEEPKLRAMRGELVEFGGYRKRAHDALGIDPDPTKDKLSPTGIPYPHLDQPQTFLDRLHHTERTLVLAWTVAPPGARKVLLFNDRAAREIDVQEAEYVLYGNEMRILAGTIAWQVDPLGNAVTRDHSTDRTKGLAKGHMSSIPEKRGFTHRSRRMGARRFGSEGAGGGRTGRGYIHGLSYGGGHTGPLYSLKRNVVGVGRRGNTYTSIYATERSIMHDCQALSGDLALPPGWDRARVRGTAKKALARIRAGKLGSANAILESARVSNPESAMLLRFLQAAVEVEADFVLDAATAIEAAGDLYEAHRRLSEATKNLKGIVRFEAFAAAPLQQLAAEANKPLLRAGEQFYRIVHGATGDEQARAARQFAAKHAGTIYAEGIEGLGKDGNAFAPFLAKQPSLEKFDYPPRPPGK